MIDPLSAVDIRVGTPEDREAVAAFALSLAEDPISSREKWLRTINEDDTYPLLAVYKQAVVAQLHARIVGEYGWLEHARVRLDFRNLGIAHTLVDAAIDWVIGRGVRRIRTQIDSDNMAARKIVERHHFTPQFLTINPSTEVLEEDADPRTTSEVAPVLDESLYEQYYQKTKVIGGNVMIDGHYLPFSRPIFEKLISQRRIYTNYQQSLMLILSDYNLPSEYHGFLVAESQADYQLGGQVLRGFAGRDLATLAICHAPSRRNALIGLAKAEFGWNQPHSIIIYGRESWQEREEDS